MIKESKNIGQLYHFTNPESALYILADNKLLCSKEFGDYFISFTRNKNYWNGAKGDANLLSVRFTFDGNKLSNNHKIIPIDFFYKKQQSLSKQISSAEDYLSKLSDDLEIMDQEEYLDSLYDKATHISSLQADEMEERLISKTPELNNISSFITEVTVDKQSVINYVSYSSYFNSLKDSYIKLAFFGEAISDAERIEQNSREVSSMSKEEFVDLAYLEFLSFLCYYRGIRYSLK